MLKISFLQNSWSMLCRWKSWLTIEYLVIQISCVFARFLNTDIQCNLWSKTIFLHSKVVFVDGWPLFKSISDYGNCCQLRKESVHGFCRYDIVESWICDKHRKFLCWSILWLILHSWTFSGDSVAKIHRCFMNTWVDAAQFHVHFTFYTLPGM